jgi:hypothetical protein
MLSITLYERLLAMRRRLGLGVGRGRSPSRRLWFIVGAIVLAFVIAGVILALSLWSISHDPS